MAAGRKPVDLGFAEFAAQIVTELHDALLMAHDEQETRRAKLADLAALPIEQFARRFIANEQIDAELIRQFPAAGGKSTRIRIGAAYKAASQKTAETPPIQLKLGVQLAARDLRVRGKQTTLAADGVKTIRDAIRLRLAETRMKTLRQAATQGLPRVVIDSGRVNVKLSFRLAELGNAAVRPVGAGQLALSNVSGIIGTPGSKLRYRLMVRQVNDETMPNSPTQASGIGELDLTFKTI